MNTNKTDNLIIITGASRGIGLSLSRKLLNPLNHLVCISRQTNNALVNDAADSGCTMDYLNLDFSQTKMLEPSLEELFSGLQKRRFSRLSLVNNAGMLAPVMPLGRADGDMLAMNLAVNAAAPILLMNLFIRHFGALDAEKRIINISSGAASNPYPGWVAYCSAKAALKMATRCIHAEQEANPNRVKVVSFAPGVVDTAMQDEIRNTSREFFAPVQRFRKLKEDGLLLNPDTVADRITRLIFDESFPDGEDLDIRD